MKDLVLREEKRVFTNFPIPGQLETLLFILSELRSHFSIFYERRSIF